jgi:hypothetical protein
MIAEFNWWLLLLGLVVGGGLTWLVLAETRRREQDLEEDELAAEATWLEARMAEEGTPLPADTLERVVQLHRAYLAIVPPSDPFEEEWRAEEPEAETARPVPAREPSPEDGREPSIPSQPATSDETGVRHEVRGG